MSTPQSTVDGISDGNFPVGIIVGCVIGIFFCATSLLLAIVLVCYCLKRKKAKFDIAEGMLAIHNYYSCE